MPVVGPSRVLPGFLLRGPQSAGRLACRSEEFYALTHADLVLNYELAGEPREAKREARERCV